MITMTDILKYAADLQPLPQTACKLASLVADEKSTIEDISSVIEFDPVLTAEVLRYANSVMSGSKRRIDSVKGAVIRMGAARILERIIAGHLESDLKQPVDAYGLLQNELWRHSVAAAVAAESLGAFTGMKITGLAFTAALLHDIGKLLVGKVIGRELLTSLLDKMNNDSSLSFETVERNLIGYSHAQIGAQLCGAWNLPDRLVIAVRDHHRGSESEEIITDCVRMSNLTAKIIGEGIGHEGMALQMETDCAHRFGFNKESFEAFCATVKLKFNDIITFIGAGHVDN